MKQLSRLKDRLKSYKTSTQTGHRILYHSVKMVYSACRAPYRFLTQGDYRSIVFLRLLAPGSIHQTTILTARNRYPDIFAACQGYFSDKKELRILSYGCSTGEEILSLRHYFPNAILIGAEINPHCLKICQQRVADNRMTFIHSTPDNITSHGPYDAIFCMAVLQRTPHLIMEQKITNISKIYPFTRFDEALVLLDQQLNLDGLMIVHYSQYLFTDSSIATRYERLSTPIHNDYDSPIFDRNGDLIHDGPPADSIFIKVKDAP